MEEKDVAAAVAAVAAVVGKIPNPKAQAAAKVVKKAAPFAGVAARVAPAAAKAAAPVAKKVGHAVADGAVAAKEKVAGGAGVAKVKVASGAGVAKEKIAEGAGFAKGRIFAGAGAAKEKIAGAVAAGKGKAHVAAEKRREQMSRAEGRRALLACAPIAIDAATLQVDAAGASEAQGAAANQFVHFPGCYAAITYGSKFKPKCPDEYRAARVFFSPDMGRSLVDDVEGRGDTDVYADAKYGQHVRFYLFPCSEEDARELLPSLAAVLGNEAGDEAEAEDAPEAAPADGGEA